MDNEQWMMNNGLYIKLYQMIPESQNGPKLSQMVSNVPNVLNGPTEHSWKDQTEV